MKGIGLALVGAILFGAVTGASKLLLGSAGSATAGALTFFGAGLVGSLAMPLTTAAPSGGNGRKTRYIFCAATTLGAVAAPLLLMTGLRYTPAPLASILTNIEGIATAGLAWLFFRERADTRSVVGIVAILGGVVCFGLSDDLGGAAGHGWLLVAAAYLCWAVDANMMKCVPGIPPARATALRGLAGALIMAAVAWLRGEAVPDAGTIAGGLLIGALGFGASFMLMLKALALMGAARTGAMFACAPVFGYLCSASLESGTFSGSVPQWLALALIAAGILTCGIDAFMPRPAAGRETRTGALRT